MIPLCSKRYQYTYLFNAKSACTTYRKLFVDLHRDELPPDQQRSMDIHNAAYYFEPPVGGNFFQFTIVRNPFTRLVSAYLDKCVELNFKAEARYRTPHHVETIFKPIFGFLGREPDYAQGFTFAEFLAYLADVSANHRPVDIHFAPQRKTGIRIDALYRVEDPVEELLAIFHHVFQQDFFDLQLESRIRRAAGERANSTVNNSGSELHATNPLYEAGFAELISLREQGYKLDYGRFYNDELRQTAAQVSAAELRSYDYDYPY